MLRKNKKLRTHNIQIKQEKKLVKLQKTAISSLKALNTGKKAKKTFKIDQTKVFRLSCEKSQIIFLTKESTMFAQKRQIRKQALEILYQMEFQENIQKQISQSKIDKAAQDMALAVISHKEKIDKLLSQKAQNWKLDRMALIDLNILRIAIYEMVFSPEKESSKIFINEAIEIAKIYGSSDSPQFVNGVLDAVCSAEGK